jgi:peroxiredoxin
MTVEIGAQAPDFALRNQHGETVRLADYRGKQAVLVMFYPWAFSSTCGSELHQLQERIDEFQNDDVAVLGVSCDAMYALRAYSDAQRFEFPLLADSWPQGGVATAYGVFDDRAGAALRGSFLVDRDGVVRWSVVNGIGEARDLDDASKALAQL